MRDESRGWAATRLQVLIVDPDPAAYQVVHEVCRLLGVTLTACSSGADSLYLFGRLRPDIVIIATEMTDISCPEVVAALRKHTSVPIVVGANGDMAAAAAPAIAAGATRLLLRPYERRQLQPLLNAMVARAQDRLEQEARVRLGPLELDSLAHEARAAGSPLSLTVKEFELLRFLMLHADRVVGQQRIREEVWGSRGPGPTANTIAVHIRRIRAQLGDTMHIVNIRGVGYRLAPPAEQQSTRAAVPRAQM